MDIPAEIWEELKMCYGALNIPFLINNMHPFGQWVLLISVEIGREELIWAANTMMTYKSRRLLM